MGGGGEGSLKHVVHKRVHLERPQPVARKRLGHLEKHKDYVKRAKDFHRKEDAIKKLHQKAYFKNDEEFAFSMLNKKVEDGRLRKKASHLSDGELKLLESQDARYVRMREQIDRKACAKKAESLHFLNADKPNKHVLFVGDDDDDDDEVGGGAVSSTKGTDAASKLLREFNVAAHFDTHPALLGNKANRPTLKQLETAKFTDQKDLEKESHFAYKELFHRQERAKKLKNVRSELELRNHLRSKGKRKKVADGENGRPAEYKWIPERKR